MEEKDIIVRKMKRKQDISNALAPIPFPKTSFSPIKKSIAAKD